MFNSYYIGGDTTNNKCEVHLNAPSTGFIQKSNPMSRFIRFQRGSRIEDLLFPEDTKDNPRLAHENHYGLNEYEEVTVLQVCIFGNDHMLAEYVFNKDLK